MRARVRTYEVVETVLDNSRELIWSSPTTIAGPGDLQKFGLHSVLVLSGRDLAERDVASWGQSLGLYVLRGGEIRWLSQ